MPEPLWAIGLSKPILNAQRHHATSTRQKATNVSIMLLTDQRFCMTPPYRTARPGRLISPTKVAAVICHALSPAFNQCGYDSQVMCLRSYCLWMWPDADPRKRATHAFDSPRMKSGWCERG